MAKNVGLVAGRISFLLCHQRYLVLTGPALFILLICPKPAWCQAVATGTIEGAVTDTSDAVVPAASVEITQTETNTVTRIQTDESGRYFVPNLRVGAYAVTVGKTGFKTGVRTGMVLVVGQIMEVNLTLELGSSNQKVTVTGSAPLIETTEATIGQVIENRQIVQLPLNGRSFAQLAFLSPTVVPSNSCCPSLFAPNFSVPADFSIGGSHGEDNEFLLDGFSVIQDNTGGTYLYPSVDAIEEFKIVQNSYMPELGGRIGQVMIVSKGGTNLLHGSAFEFLRNDALDARNSFALVKGPYKQNQFGATIGGPLVKDKTFWFFSYEGTRIRAGTTQTAIVPSAAMRQGDFSELLPGVQLVTPVDYPGAGLKAGDKIPGNRIDMLNSLDPRAINPIALNVINLTDYPLPNAPGNTYVANPVSPTDQNYYQVRVDQNIRERDRIWGSAFLEKYFTGTPPFTTFPLERNVTNATAGQIGLHWVHIFKPNITNDLRAGYNQDSWDSPNPSDPSFTHLTQQDLGFPMNDNQPTFGQLPHAGAGIPAFTISGYGQAGGIGFGGPELFRYAHYELGDTLNYIRGGHRMAFGGRIVRFHQDQRHLEQARGGYDFSGQYSGDGFADFLLGYPDNAVREIIFVPNRDQQEFYDRANQYGIFAQDSWQVNEKLAVDLGLRYEYFAATNEKEGRVANFLPRGGVIYRVEGPGGTGGSTSPAGTSLGTQGFNIDPNCLCTRPKRDFAPRIGFAYRPAGRDGQTVIRAAGGLFYSKTVENAFQALQFNPPWVYTDQPFNRAPVTVGGPGPSFDMTNAFIELGGASNSGYAFDANQKDVTVQQWSLAVERQVTTNVMASLTYVGSESYHIMANPYFNGARPGPGDFQPRRPYPGLVPPNADPYPVSPVYLSYYSGGYLAAGNYNALTGLVKKQFSGGLTLLAHFTWSKSIDSASSYLTTIQNPEDIAAERGLSTFHTPYRFVSSWIWDLPFGSGKRFLSGAHGVTQQVLGGWQSTAILSVNAGFYLTPSSAVNTANVDTGGVRPDRVCDGRLANSNRNLWFDTSCFPLAAPFLWGTSGRDIIQGPGAFNFDFSFLKDFQVTERQRVQFRAEFFDGLNHTNLGNPNTTIGTGAAGQIFGTSGAVGARQIQFALKYIF
jgi:hypothetical protein